jgi:hypothetical protein
LPGDRQRGGNRRCGQIEAAAQQARGLRHRGAPFQVVIRRAAWLPAGRRRAGVVPANGGALSAFASPPPAAPERPLGRHRPCRSAAPPGRLRAAS